MLTFESIRRSRRAVVSRQESDQSTSRRSRQRQSTTTVARHQTMLRGYPCQKAVEPLHVMCVVRLNRVIVKRSKDEILARLISPASRADFPLKSGACVATGRCPATPFPNVESAWRSKGFPVSPRLHHPDKRLIYIILIGDTCLSPIGFNR